MKGRGQIDFPGKATFKKPSLIRVKYLRTFRQILGPLRKKLKWWLFPITHIGVLKTWSSQISFSKLLFRNASRNKSTQCNIFHEHLVGIKLYIFLNFFLNYFFLDLRNWKLQNWLNKFVGQKWLSVSVWPNFWLTKSFHRQNKTQTNSRLKYLVTQVPKVMPIFLKRLQIINMHFI